MSSLHMFDNSHNFVINGGSFQNVVSVEDGDKYAGIFALQRYASTSALHNAGARYPPPRVHPGTRTAVLSSLKQWASLKRGHNDNKRNPPVRWLYGPAGAGKSAIAQTFAETCANSGELAASFFFWRQDPSRNSIHRLFTTIAWQLATSVPELRSIINTIIILDPSVLTSSAENQFNMLILQPWAKALIASGLKDATVQKDGKNHPLSPSTVRSHTKWLRKASKNGVASGSSFLTRYPIVIIIDGLDECSHSHDQQLILSLLGNAVQKQILSVQLLIASRPEPRIKEAFSKPEFTSISHWMALNDTYQASSDIRVFLQDKFRDILTRHSHTMEHVPRPWPTAGQIEHLVQKASGHFIYPSTVLKYIDDDGAVPAERLDAVLSLAVPDEGTQSPFAELDALYCQILSVNKNTTVLLEILGSIITFRSIGESISEEAQGPTTLIKLLSTGLKSVGALRAGLSGLHSLFEDPSPVDCGLKFCHASFTDFLLDHKRSLQFFANKAVGHDFLARCCLAYMSKTLKAKNGDITLYVHHNWEKHCIQAIGSSNLISQLDAFDVYTVITFILRLEASGYGFLSEALVTFLIQVFQVWVHTKDKYGTNLQNFHSLTTIGFYIEFSHSKKIPIPLSLKFYSLKDIPRTRERLKNHIATRMGRVTRFDVSVLRISSLPYKEKRKFNTRLKSFLFGLWGLSRQ